MSTVSEQDLLRAPPTVVYDQGKRCWALRAKRKPDGRVWWLLASGRWVPANRYGPAKAHAPSRYAGTWGDGYSPEEGP